MIRVAAIVGPTAVGKSQLAVRVANVLDAEIVSIDSMQAYRGMGVGTAKPDAALREAVPHHMLDVFDPEREVTVAEFRDAARITIGDISSRGHLPLLVGGSGLYFRAVVDDLRFPPRSQEARMQLEAESEQLGAEALHRRLTEIDPVAASRIEPGNARRTIRALEAIEITGELFSSNDSWDRYESIYDLHVVGLTLEREVLYSRIVGRVDKMIADGLEKEARDLNAAGLGRTARQALGYRQVLEAAPGADTDRIRDEIVRATKRFARRQESWFRSDPRIAWIDAADADVAEKVLRSFESRSVERA
ncbi:MAG: tRNA (adenosine(37)-N6)-dimethylallyltransferase MiaA [Actinomycetota bacterium]